MGGTAHSPLTLASAFTFHLEFAKSGDMRQVSWDKRLSQ
jgi:hypothetical protein